MGSEATDTQHAPNRTRPELVTARGHSVDVTKCPALVQNRRFPADSAIAKLAAAVQEGQGAVALDVLRSGGSEVEFVEVDDDAYLSSEQLAGVRAEVKECGGALHEAADEGNATRALRALERHRLLCAHRRGMREVQYWSALAARWIAETHPVIPRADGRYSGEPLLVTTNDYDIGLYNGDTGVVVNDGQGGPSRGLRARRRTDHRPPHASGCGSVAACHDGAPQSGQPVRAHHGSATSCRLASGDPGNSLHGGDPGQGARPGDRVGGGVGCGGRPPRRPGNRLAATLEPARRNIWKRGLKNGRENCSGIAASFNICPSVRND